MRLFPLVFYSCVMFGCFLFVNQCQRWEQQSDLSQEEIMLRYQKTLEQEQQKERYLPADSSQHVVPTPEIVLVDGDLTELK